MQVFKVDEESCTFGQLSAKGQYRAKSNFIMELDTYVEAGPGTEAGFFVWITRRTNRERK